VKILLNRLKIMAYIFSQYRLPDWQLYQYKTFQFLDNSNLDMIFQGRLPMKNLLTQKANMIWTRTRMICARSALMLRCTQMISMISRATRGKGQTDIFVVISSLELITNLRSRFEEIKDDEPVKQKRVRESDAADVKSPAEKKNKKLKADGGKAVAVDAAEGGKEKKDKKKKNAEQKIAMLASDGAEKETKASAERTIAGGIVVEDAKTGTGPQAKKGSTVRMRYVGKLTNGKVFDKNTGGKPVRYHSSSRP
jgi:FKBP-type peptidyl-prolyl cis-trans isomerase